MPDIQEIVIYLKLFTQQWRWACDLSRVEYDLLENVMDWLKKLLVVKHKNKLIIIKTTLILIRVMFSYARRRLADRNLLQMTVYQAKTSID